MSLLLIIVILWAFLWAIFFNGGFIPKDGFHLSSHFNHLPFHANYHLSDAYQFQSNRFNKAAYEQTIKDLTSLQGSCTIMYSAVVTTYGEPMDALHRAIDSITAQGTNSFEIIVVNDGHPDLDAFRQAADVYKTKHMKHHSAKMRHNSPVSSVDTTFLDGVNPNVLNDDGSVNAELLHVRHHCPPAGVVKFVTKPNGGLGSARNFGISFASGVWIHPIDADDTISKDLISEVIDSLHHLKKPGSKKKFRTLGNPGEHNIIMPWLGDAKGKVTSWEPKNINDIDIKVRWYTDM